MPEKRNIKLFFMDILESIENIKEYTQNMNYSDFKTDKKTRDAVVRNLEVIGEAAKSMPDEIKNKYSQVNWRAIIGMRDKLIHGYFGVSLQIVWETIKKDIPTLENQIKEIFKKMNGD